MQISDLKVWKPIYQHFLSSAANQSVFMWLSWLDVNLDLCFNISIWCIHKHFIPVMIFPAFFSHSKSPHTHAHGHKTQWKYCQICMAGSDLRFVKNFTQPDFFGKQFYTPKTRKSRLFLLQINQIMFQYKSLWSFFVEIEMKM